MTSLLSLRLAPGAAVAELPALAGSWAFADQNRKLGRTIAGLVRAGGLIVAWHNDHDGATWQNKSGV